MKQVIVAVRDSAMGSFARPFFVPTVAVAVRSFTDEVNRVDPQNQMNVHPEDFELHQLGEFDEESGQFSQSPESFRMLARAKDVKQEA